MKKLLCGVAAFAVLAGAAPAFAQNQYYAKDRDNILDEAQYTEPEPDAPVNVEPQAGNEMRSPARAVREETSDGLNFADFTGPYVGGDVGYSIGSYDTTDPAGPDGDVGLDGWEGGVFVGYGFSKLFNWLGAYTGIEAGYNWSGADGSIAGNDFEKDHNWTVTLRPGLTMHEDALVYGVVGYSRAEFEAEGEEENLDGLVLGAGSEFDTETPLKLRLEYTYTNYEDTDIAAIGFDGHENNLKLGAVFRF